MNQRIDSIDILRGFAVLGILIMNISSFSMPSMAYFSPVIYDINTINHITYSITHIIADQKFMAIFSMLFGASTMLYINSIKRNKKRPLLLFYSRNFWLLMLGWIHASYLWYGDVLIIYSICSFVLFFFIGVAPKNQFILGCSIYFLPTFSNYALYEFVIDYLDQAEKDVIIQYWNPPNEVLQQELDVYRGSYKDQIQHRAEMWSSSEHNKNNPSGGKGAGIIGLSFLMDLFSRSFGMMLIGMACFTWGVFNNTLSRSFYKKLIIYGFGIGFPLSIAGLFLNYTFDWNWKYMQFLGRSPNNIATPLIAFGYIGLIMLWIQKGSFRNIQGKLRAIGKTALTAYFIQTVMATLIFYGIGLGLFGYVNRLYQLIIMFFIWFTLLKLCPAWMNKYHYGPLEWVWRMLTHFKLIPLSKQ